MKIKNKINYDIYNGDFWNDIGDGYLTPDLILDDPNDINEINSAIEVLRNLQELLEEYDNNDEEE